MRFGLEDSIIKKIQQVFEAYPKVDKVLVFGSRAKGNYRADSDIDLAIKGEDITFNDILKISNAFEENGLIYKIDLINYSDIKEKDLIEHIDRVGIKIYSRWKEYKIGDIITLEYGKSLLNYRNDIGLYNVYGTNGKIGTCDNYLYDKPSVIIGRKGAYRETHFSKKPFFVIDTAFYTKKKFADLDTLFLYYWFKNININEMDSGSAIPSTSRDEVYDLKIKLPPLPEQTAIANIFSSLDDKIDLLQRQNKTLEQLAETLFRQWFVEEADENWGEKAVSKIIDVRDGTHDSPKQKEIGFHLITSKHLKPNGIDFSSAYKISEQDFININKRSKVDRNDILFSMIGTLGLIHYVEEEPNFAIKNIGLFKSSQKPSFAKFLYLFLKSELGRQFIHESADGSTQEYISLGSLRQLKFKYPGELAIKEFDKTISPYFEKIQSNYKQVRTLSQLRDLLLPKLMSGEVRVKL